MWHLTREEQMVLLFGAAVFLAGMGVKLMGGIPYSPNFSSSKELVKVKISGAVKKPGWYNLPEGSLVIEGIRKAGGVLPRANLKGISLGSPLEDREEIWVPGEKLNVNRASLEQLIYLPGIGSVLAQRIIEYRRKRGRFHTLSELKEVPGIGEVKFEKIKEKITVDDE